MTDQEPAPPGTAAGESDPLDDPCSDCGRGPLECEVLLALKAGLSGLAVHDRLNCATATVERLRARVAQLVGEVQAWKDGVCQDCVDREKYVAQLVGEVRELEGWLRRMVDLWSDFTSQEMYGEHIRAGMEEKDFEEWASLHFDARAALRAAGRGTRRRDDE